MANFLLWGDVNSAKNRVPPPVTSCHLLRVPPSLPPWGDVIYGCSLISRLSWDTTFCVRMTQVNKSFRNREKRAFE